MNVLQGVLPPGDLRGPDDDNLEAEFRQILFIIKPYIDRINNHHYIKMYGLWLKKLSQIQNDKKERNKYLLELANQIHDGALKNPFTRVPPSGPLPPLSKYIVPAVAEEEPGRYWPAVEPAKNFTSPQQYKEMLKKRLRKLKPVQKLGPIKKPSSGRNRLTSTASSKTSWQDLSDAPGSCAGDGDLDEGTNDDLNDQEEVGEEEDVTSCVTNTTELSRKYSEMHQIEGKRLARAYAQKFKQPAAIPQQCSTMTLTESHREMDMLKTRVLDLVEVKTSLRESHTLSEERKKTISILKKKLDDVTIANKELHEVVEMMTKKNVDLEIFKNRADHDARDSFNRVRAKELEALNQKHDDAIKALRNEHKSELDNIKSEFFKKISDLEQTRKDEIKGLMMAHDLKMKEKDEELEMVKRTAGHGDHDDKADDGKEEQILDLKKCISKMDKLLEKSEKDYLKKIEKLKHELELKDLTMNMKLQTQKAELLLKNQSNKQHEVTTAVQGLEEKYRNILLLQKTQAQETEENHMKTINELKQLLNKFDIPYQC